MQEEIDRTKNKMKIEKKRTLAKKKSEEKKKKDYYKSEAANWI